MPITPLHLGVMAPVNHFLKGKVSNLAFFITTLWLDARAIAHWFFNLPLPDHTETSHTIIGALGLALVVSCIGLLKTKNFMPWLYGAFLAAITHIILDALVHPEMRVLGKENPLYAGGMVWVSAVLLPLTVWWVAQIVSYIRRGDSSQTDEDPQSELGEHSSLTH